MVKGIVIINGISLPFTLDGFDLTLKLVQMEDITLISSVVKDANGALIYSINDRLDSDELTGTLSNGNKILIYLKDTFIFDCTDEIELKCRCYCILRDSSIPNIIRFFSPVLFDMCEVKKIINYEQNNQSEMRNINLPIWKKDEAEFHDFVVDSNTLSIAFTKGYEINLQKSKPIRLYGGISLQFDSKNFSIKYLYMLYLNTKRLLNFLCLCQNVTFNEINLVSKTDDIHSQLIGDFFVDTYETINNLNKNNNFIPYSLFKHRLSQLASQIFNHNMYLRHLPISNNSMITEASFILLFAGFEYEFNKKYKIPHKMSTIKARKNIETKLNNLKESSNSKEKKILKNLIDHVADDIFTEKIRHILNIYSYQIGLLCKDSYVNNNIEFSIDTIAERLGEQRNALVHGNIKKSFEKEIIVDYYVLMKATYFIQLLNVGFNAEESVKMIKVLFKN